MPAITEIEIQLYIDHCLPEERKRAVKEYLYDDLTAAQRVGAYERHADALRRALFPVAEMPLPRSSSQARLRRNCRCRLLGMPTRLPAQSSPPSSRTLNGDGGECSKSR